MIGVLHLEMDCYALLKHKSSNIYYLDIGNSCISAVDYIVVLLLCHWAKSLSLWLLQVLLSQEMWYSIDGTNLGVYKCTVLTGNISIVWLLFSTIYGSPAWENVKHWAEILHLSWISLTGGPTCVWKLWQISQWSDAWNRRGYFSIGT